MKNIKLRIVYLILCSALLLFALFMLAVNLIIPAHFVREAKKALISEAQYQNRTIPYTDDGQAAEIRYVRYESQSGAGWSCSVTF